MSRNRNTRSPDQDERLGSGGFAATGEEAISNDPPALPLVDGDRPLDDRSDDFDDEPVPVRRAAGVYNRDDSDRLIDEREMQERELTDEERLEMFRLSMFQNQLPNLPEIPGYHCIWLTTTNPRDSIQARQRLGYKLIESAELPGWEASVVAEGAYAGYVMINEMIAAKLPLRLYEMYMTEAHHNQPLAEEGKLVETLNAIREQAGKRAQVELESGTAELGKARKPRFEGVTR